MQAVKWAVEGMVKSHDVLAYVSCRGYVCIPQRVRLFAVNQGGTADLIIRPW